MHTLSFSVPRKTASIFKFNDDIKNQRIHFLSFLFSCYVAFPKYMMIFLLFANMMYICYCLEVSIYTINNYLLLKISLSNDTENLLFEHQLGELVLFWMHFLFISLCYDYSGIY